MSSTDQEIHAGDLAAGDVAGGEPAGSRPRALDDQFESFLRNNPDAMLVVDGEGQIVFANPAVTAVFGYAPDALIGQRMGKLIPQDFEDEDTNRVLALLKRSDPRDASSDMVVEGRHSGGSRLELAIGLTLLGEAHGDLAVWTVHEVRQGEHAPRRSVQSESRLNAAQRIAKIGNWEWDVVTDEHWWSDELYRVLEIDPTEARSFDAFIDRIHPDDREFFQESRLRVIDSGVPEVIEVRVRLPDGREKVIQCQGEITFDESGAVVRMSGTLQDVSERKAVEAALLQSDSRYREAQRIAKIGNWEWDIATGASWWSDELYRILEEEPAEYEASLDSFLRKVHVDDRRLIVESTQNVSVEPGSYQPSEIRLSFPDGRVKVVELRVDVKVDEHGQPAIVSGTVRDVTERWSLESRLRESEERYSTTVKLAAIGIAHVDPTGRFIWVNQHMCEMLGYDREELLGLTIKQVSHPEDVDVTDEARRRLHAGTVDTLKIEKRYRRKDGRTIWVRIACAVRRGDAGEPLYDISAMEDISDRRATEERVKFLATHDEMTGLPNRMLFNELLNEAVASASSGRTKCSLMFIDVDRFKIVNDSLGHEAGDSLLKAMAARLRRCMGESEVLARLGGDEFVALIRDVTDVAALAERAKAILNATLKPMRIAGQECRVTVSIGIACYPDDAADAASLMKHADMAMYLAKEEGKNNYQFYSPHDAPMSVDYLALESHLSRALEQEEFAVQYQPKVDLETGVISGAEALLRWWNHDLGTVSPAQFIPLAEDTGLIVPIGRWILGVACSQCVSWQRQGLPPVVMTVNLSPRQFKDPNLLDDIAGVLEGTGIEPGLLELEITESMLMHDVDQAVERVAAIKNLGVRIAIDDFGTGYSSLAQLKRLPIDTLKVDRSFVRDIPGNAEDEAIIETIISLGKTLGVTVVAEGVETEAQLVFLREHACDEMQGFYFSKPCHPDTFAGLLAFAAKGRTLP